MTVQAYVLVLTTTGHAFFVADEVRAIEGVNASDVVTGPYDVIAELEAPTLDELARLVVSQIQVVEGITRTYTCPVVRL
jgi:DNA-binding Lrp family transcriptional regulator